MVLYFKNKSKNSVPFLDFAVISMKIQHKKTLWIKQKYNKFHVTKTVGLHSAPGGGHCLCVRDSGSQGHNVTGVARVTTSLG